MVDTSVKSNLSVGTASTATANPNDTAVANFTPSSQTPVDVISRSLKKTTVTEGLMYPGEVPPYYFRMQLSEYHRFDGNGGNLFQISRLDPFATIVLPLPQQLINNDQVIYDQAQLGIIGGNGLNAIANGANVRKENQENSMNNLQSALGRVGQFAKDTGPAAGVVAADIALSAADAKAPGIKSLATDAARLAGYTPNQFLTILLKGPAYKRHQFTWLFAPHNEDEMRNLQKIILTIENAKAPSWTAGGALFTFPAVFRCAILPNSQFMYKFKPAVLEGFTVDYTGGGMPLFRRAGPRFNMGKPGVIQISMQFLEIEYWLQGNYSDNNDPDDVSFGSPI